MGYIKEPKGVDFVVVKKTLTKEEEEEFSRFLSDYKKRQKAKKHRKAA